MSWHPLYLWHHIHYIWCYTLCVYDNTCSISDLKHILSAITSTVYVITPTLSKTSHQLCKTSQVAYICHHVHYTWHHIHPLRQQPFVFMTSHALYWWHHMHYIWHAIYCVSTLSHRIHSITTNHSIYDITCTLGLTSHPCIRHGTHCIFFITTSPLISHPLWMTSLPPSVWNHMNYI